MQHCWANIIVSCCAMLADVCKRSQQVTTCWVFRWEYKGLWDMNTHNSIHTTLWFIPIIVADWHVVHMRRCNFVECAVQTNPTLLDHVSMTTKQLKCWHLLALKFDQFQTSSKHFQQVAATCNNTQHGVQTLATCWAQQCCVLLANNVASVCTSL